MTEFEQQEQAKADGEPASASIGQTEREPAPPGESATDSREPSRQQSPAPGFDYFEFYPYGYLY